MNNGVSNKDPKKSDDEIDRATNIVTFDQLVDRYDAFILDQYGVLHNGGPPLPGVIDCLEKLLDHGKYLCINSNSPRDVNGSRRKMAMEHGLQQFFPDDSKNKKMGVMTSGELLRRYIQNQNWTEKKCICFGWKETKKNQNHGFGTSNSSVDPTKVDFIIVAGNGGIVDLSNGQVMIPSNLQSSGEIEPIFKNILTEAAKRKLPMLVGNNDIVAKGSDGTLLHCCGVVANYYEKELHGPTIRFGKPDATIFNECIHFLLQQSNYSIPRERICHVGDSLHHDILGANNTGIDSIFIATGIHMQEIVSPSHNDITQEVNDLSLLQRNVKNLFMTNNLWPTFTAYSFKWK